MATVEAKRRARAEYKQRLRRKGYAWRCIDGAHAPACSGLVGRLMQGGKPRPACPCRCHQEEIE